MNTLSLLDNEPTFGTNADGVFIRRDQEVTDDLLSHIADERHAASYMRSQDYRLAASVPTGVVEVWLAQGRPVYSASCKDVVKWLRADGLDAFVASKRV